MRYLKRFLRATVAAAILFGVSPVEAQQNTWRTDCRAFAAHVGRLVSPGRIGPLQGAARERLIGQQVEFTLIFERVSYTRVEFDDVNLCPFSDDNVLVSFTYALDSRAAWDAVAPGAGVRVSARIAEVGHVILNGGQWVNAPFMFVTLDQAQPVSP